MVKTLSQIAEDADSSQTREFPLNRGEIYLPLTSVKIEKESSVAVPVNPRYSVECIGGCYNCNDCDD